MTDELDKLRLEVREAVSRHSLYMDCPFADVTERAVWNSIRAELLRLAEYEQAAGRLAIEKAEFRQRAEQYESELAALKARTQWQPIEKAPKDGNRVQTVVMPCPVAMGAFWRRSRWITDEGVTIHPTHWMPLPEPPAERGEG